MTVCVKQTMIPIGCSDCQGEGIMAHNHPYKLPRGGSYGSFCPVALWDECIRWDIYIIVSYL